MAGFLINRCVINGGGTGGFVTAGFANLLDYVVDNQEDPFLEQSMFRKTLYSTRYDTKPQNHC